MYTWVRDHGLMLASLARFVAFFGGMVGSGLQVDNSGQLEHQQPAVPVAAAHSETGA